MLLAAKRKNPGPIPETGKKFFSLESIPVLGLTQRRVQQSPGAISAHVKRLGWGVKLTTFAIAR
jgi:hypothetical protein